MTKTVLITGATSGFGRAAARRFCDEGWNVIGTGRRAERLEELKSELGSKFHGLVFDIADEKSTADALNSLPDTFKPIDVLVNNAGLALGTAPAQETKLQDWHQMIDTNIKGLVTITHHLLPKLIEQKGMIINLASIAAHYPYPGGNVYGGTKAFVHQFSYGLRSDLHGTGVRVTAIEPGMAESEFTLVRTGGSQEASDKLYDGAKPLTPEDIAEQIFWVATLPPHVNINTLEAMPVSQSWAPFQVHRGN